MTFNYQPPCKKSKVAMIIEVHQDQEEVNLSLVQIKHIADNILDSSTSKRDVQELTSVAAVLLEIHKHTLVVIPKLLHKDIRLYILN